MDPNTIDKIKMNRSPLISSNNAIPKNTNVGDNNTSQVFEEEVLVIIIDVNWKLWVDRIFTDESNTSSNSNKDNSIKPQFNCSLDISEMCSVIFQFLRTYTLLSSLKRFAIIAIHSNSSKIIFEGYMQNIFSQAKYGSQLERISKLLWDFIEKSAGYTGDSMLSSALSMSLCYINRVRKENVNRDGRIILIDTAYDDAYSSQYIPLMNCTFNAAKNRIIVDTCALSNKPPTIPEQISEITGGIYLKLASALSGNPNIDPQLALLQLLNFHYLTSPSVRKTISAVTQKNKANYAVCFCHNRPVNITSVCSCCLAIYCSDKIASTGKDRISCDICKARFTKALVRNKQVADVDLSAYS